MGGRSVSHKDWPTGLSFNRNRDLCNLGKTSVNRVDIVVQSAHSVTFKVTRSQPSWTTMGDFGLKCWTELYITIIKTPIEGISSGRMMFHPVQFQRLPISREFQNLWQDAPRLFWQLMVAQRLTMRLHVGFSIHLSPVCSVLFCVLFGFYCIESFLKSLLKLLWMCWRSEGRRGGKVV